MMSVALEGGREGEGVFVFTPTLNVFDKGVQLYSLLSFPRHFFKP